MSIDAMLASYDAFQNQVTQLSLEDLPRLRIRYPHFARHLPDVSGVYLILNYDGDVRYIGRARSLYDRWNVGIRRDGTQTPIISFLSKHHIYGKMFYESLMGDILLYDRSRPLQMRWLELPHEIIATVEMILIRHHKPPWNTEYLKPDERGVPGLTEKPAWFQDWWIAR